MRIVLTGGGTAGHLLPFEGILAALRGLFREQQQSLPAKLEPDVLKLHFLGVANKQTKAFFAEQDVRAVHIPSGKLRRYASGVTIFDLLFRLPWGILLALVRMYLIMPDVVVSKGGYASVPTVLAAAFYRIPILLHESDAVMGLANTKLIKYARVVTLGFAGARARLGKFAYKGFATGTPVRDGLSRIDKAEAKKVFGIAESEHVLLVTGGSQGAKQLNEVLLQVLPSLIQDTSVIHLTGRDHFQAVATVAGELLAQSSRREAYKPFAYLTDTMRQALAAADSIVTRAGATTLAEIAALGTPALLVPLAGAAQDHQRMNAQVFEDAGAALVLDPTNLGPNLFENNIRRLVSDEAARAQIQEHLAGLDRPKAAREIAKLAFKIAQGYAPSRG